MGALTNVGSFQNVVLALHFKWGTFLRDVRFQPESTFCKSDQIEGHHLIPCGFEKILGIQNILDKLLDSAVPFQFSLDKNFVGFEYI